MYFLFSYFLSGFSFCLPDVISLSLYISRHISKFYSDLKRALVLLSDCVITRKIATTKQLDPGSNSRSVDSISRYKLTRHIVTVRELPADVHVGVWNEVNVDESVSRHGTLLKKKAKRKGCTSNQPKMLVAFLTRGHVMYCGTVKAQTLHYCCLVVLP